MTQELSFKDKLNNAIEKYDLLCHPFYQAWSVGQLTREDLRNYACDYYHQVTAFPEYLGELAKRLPDGAVREMVLQNKEDEEAPTARSHADLWLDFAEGFGACRDDVAKNKPLHQISEVVNLFHHYAQKGSTAEALAAFYAYESQIPRIAAEKEAGLRQRYNADDTTCYYFTLHKAYDILHSKIWLELLAGEVSSSQEQEEVALKAAEKVAKSLWSVLDGFEHLRKAA